MMDNLFDDLLNKYLLETITPEETRQFFSMLDTPASEEALKQHIGREFLEDTYNEREDLVRRERIKKRLAALRDGERQDKKTFRVFSLGRVAAAAVVLVAVAVGAHYFLNDRPSQAIVKTEQPAQKNDIAPGGNKAVLTLSNGTKIILDSAANGTITQQGNTKVIKLDSGQLAYREGGIPPLGGQGVGFNTISTPKGGQYQIVLSDGSKVWLNAASSLKYPTAFTGKERVVELTGEGYFEVAHNPAKPFQVTVAGMTVEVLGTHFNINAYDDEAAIKTTLLEGSVKVTSPSPLERAGVRSDNVRLTPGKQSMVTKDGAIKVTDADLDEAVAWKNGRFMFQGNNIQSVMRQLARWYDVEVKYQGNVTDEEFVGVINRSRYENISQVLEMLEKTKTVSFTIAGRSITVMPYKK